MLSERMRIEGDGPRITDAELLDEEGGRIHFNVLGNPIEGISRERLVAEIRRLRNLIAPVGFLFGSDQIEKRVALEAEARAIRAERDGD